MAEVYVREVVGNPSASIRDVDVLNRQLYEKYKAEIREITEEALSRVIKRTGQGYILDKIKFYVQNGRLYADGEGPVAREAKNICYERYGRPKSKNSDDVPDAVKAGFATGMGIVAISPLLFALLG